MEQTVEIIYSYSYKASYFCLPATQKSERSKRFFISDAELIVLQKPERNEEKYWNNPLLLFSRRLLSQFLLVFLF